MFWQVATLLDHEVDLLFFDTTSTYFETDEPDAPVARDTAASRSADAAASSGAPTARTDSGSSEHADMAAERVGSGPTASRRTPATTCPRS